MRQLLVRVADQGDTYLSWRWVDRPDQPEVEVLKSSVVTDARKRLDAALVHTGESADVVPVERVLAEGAFATPASELTLAEYLTSALLPQRLAVALLNAAYERPGERILLRVLPSPRLAPVPWELFVMPDGTRLVEVADVAHDVPAVIHVGRGRMPTGCWSDVKDGGVLYVLDPQVPSSRRPMSVAGSPGDPGYAVLQELIAQKPPVGERRLEVGARVDRRVLGQLLRHSTRPLARLVYLGHASSVAGEPGSAALHLSDKAEVYGFATVQHGHRPFTSFDLLVGTTRVESARPELDGAIMRPIDGEVPGHDIWPMPNRVALIACASGGDHRDVEPFGLVLATLNAGAELVTATRWPLPTDWAFELAGSDPEGAPTAQLVVEVDRCHEDDDPVKALAAWQRKRLAEWTTHGMLGDSPLLWAALSTHRAPARPVITGPLK
jgi:CHAT domain